ncbi:MAG: sulfur carrier protein ThiS [Planctomycetes bacterium]|nr:sulfur carrier protein ThiS [Planctomycetota bacterium]
MVKVLVNGETRELAPGTSVARLIEELGLRPEIVAVEVNRELVTRARRASTELEDGDRVELVTLVGGG